ncbi:MAG: hypothetical protein IKE38_03965, partial [Erysipelotrichaceae bacterium]|nr:hypothetical protein [Erysipelotrichaceae bacterium]
MKNEKLVNAIGMIEDKYIEEAHKANGRKFKWNWNLAGKLAIGFACLCLLVTIAPKILFNGAKGGAAQDSYFANGGDGSYNYKDYAPSSSYDSNYAVESEAAAYYSEESSGASSSRSNASNNTNLQQNKKLIVTGELNMETMDLDKMLEELNRSVNEFGGYF